MHPACQPRTLTAGFGNTNAASSNTQEGVSSFGIDVDATLSEGNQRDINQDTADSTPPRNVSNPTAMDLETGTSNSSPPQQGTDALGPKLLQQHLPPGWCSKPPSGRKCPHSTGAHTAGVETALMPHDVCMAPSSDRVLQSSTVMHQEASLQQQLPQEIVLVAVSSSGRHAVLDSLSSPTPSTATSDVDPTHSAVDLFSMVSDKGSQGFDSPPDLAGADAPPACSFPSPGQSGLAEQACASAELTAKQDCACQDHPFSPESSCHAKQCSPEAATGCDSSHGAQLMSFAQLCSTDSAPEPRRPSRRLSAGTQRRVHVAEHLRGHPLWSDMTGLLDKVSHKCVAHSVMRSTEKVCVRDNATCSCAGSSYFMHTPAATWLYITKSV